MQCEVFLTILGVIIGVAAIVLVLSLGDSAQQLILSQIEGLGAETIVVVPGREPEGPADIAVTLFANSLTESDLKALRGSRKVGGIDSIEPAVLGSAKITKESERYQASVIGLGADAPEEIFDLETSVGSFYFEDDIESNARVAVIGEQVKDELFSEGDDVVGNTIKINGQRYVVLGVMQASGSLGFFNPDDAVLIPYTTAQKQILGIDYFNRFFVNVSNSEEVLAVADDLRAVLRDLHGIDDPDKDDFFVATQQEILETVGTITQTLSIFLVAIAAISLVVGGVGIMNIMLVSVTQRTKEIGLRKAVGANRSHILIQFIIEALFLTTLGGIIGIVLAFVLAWVGAFAVQLSGLPWEFNFSVFAALLGIFMAFSVGLIFGIYPAVRASRKSPLEALRYE